MLHAQTGLQFVQVHDSKTFHSITLHLTLRDCSHCQVVLTYLTYLITVYFINHSSLKKLQHIETFVLAEETLYYVY